MAALKPLWKTVPVPTQDFAGSTVSITRGNDPNLTIDDPNAVTPLWGIGRAVRPEQVGTKETENSTTGLPRRMARAVSREDPPIPPSIRGGGVGHRVDKH